MITRAMVFLGVISVVLASSGCAMEWVRMDAAAPPFGATHAGCRAQAGEHWPVRNEVATRTVYEDQRVPCRLDEVCAIDGKYNMVPMPKEESYIVDVNASDRSSEFNACMAGAGWQQQLSGSIAARRGRRSGRRLLDRLLLNGLEATVASGE